MRGFACKEYRKSTKKYVTTPRVPRPSTPLEIQILLCSVFKVSDISLSGWSFYAKNGIAGISTNKFPAEIIQNNKKLFYSSYAAWGTIKGHFVWAFILGIDKFNPQRINGSEFNLHQWNANELYNNFHIKFPLSGHRTIKRISKISKLIRQGQVGHLRKPYERLAADLRERRITA